MAEWLKAHAWKACLGETLTWVRIPLSPPDFKSQPKMRVPKRDGKTKQPFCFEVNDGELFAFAGLWDARKDPSGNWINTCSILTTIPNDVTSTVHDRMPVILNPDSYDLWLDPGMQDVAAISELLMPYDARLMRSYPMSTRINSVVNDDEGCSQPVTTFDQQDSLFSRSVQ
jgi:putative SOS response-associated peptidase YedK